MKKVLVVDDSKTALLFVQMTLSECGFEVIAKTSPVGITELVEKENPTVILLDVEMRALAGDEAVKLIRESGARATILLYSGQSAHELEVRAAKCGADGFVKKTGDPANLLAQLNKWINPGEE